MGLVEEVLLDVGLEVADASARLAFGLRARSP